jgi:hypothetical protein
MWRTAAPDCSKEHRPLNANRRVADARERLDLQRDIIRELWTGGRDTNDAEAVLRTLRRTLEIFEQDRRQIEDELVWAKAGASFGR